MRLSPTVAKHYIESRRHRDALAIHSARRIMKLLRNYRATITYRDDASKRVSVATIKQLRGSGSVVCRRRGHFRGEKIRRGGKTNSSSCSKRRRKRKKKTWRSWRDGMEMVGDRNPRGGGGESLPRRSKLSGDASVTELTLPCAFVRKRGLPDLRFLHTPRTRTRARARAHAHLHMYLRAYARVSPSPFALLSFPLCAAHTEPSVFHPRGRLVDLPFRLPRYSPGSSNTRPSVAFSRFPSFPPRSFVSSPPR